jgi:hypothetical protein
MAIKVDSCAYISRSCLNLSDKANECLLNSDITWGSNHHSMVSISKVRNEIDDCTKEDIETIDMIICTIGPNIMIDMET